MKKKSPSRSAFFNLRVLVGFVLCLAGATIAFFAFSKASAQQDPRKPQVLVQAQYRGVLPVVKFDISPPLRDMKPLPAKECTLRENEDRDIIPHPAGPLGPIVPDPVVQRVLGKIGIPAPFISFDGNSNLCNCVPPDPNGAVGPNHVVTMSNLHFQIFDKSGTSLFGPAANNTLWSGFGGDCQTDNSGDPVVLYDQLADRWILTQFTSSGPTYFECVAVSQTNDPTGSYFRYAISTGNNFPDYPKAGMWPDAYYFSTREFAGANFAGVGAYALDRAQALAGNPNPTIVGFLAPPNPLYVVGDGLLPSDLDGQTLPPNGSPNFFVGSQDDNASYGAPSDALNLWKFHYDPSVPSNSTFTLTNTLPTQPFNSILSSTCTSTRSCIPQPGTTTKIDHLGYRQRPLFRLAYRNFGDHESLVTNQSVNAGTGPNGAVSGVRWWELRSPNNNPVIFQEGTYAPGLTDGIHRWMGSIAMNSLGDIALGYSASNDTNPSLFPSVFYTARHAGDPPGQMTLGEGSIINGTGSQTTSFHRWGDYSAIDIDPTDDTTFWYISEYVPTTSDTGWRLRIGAFNLGGAPMAQDAFSRKVHGGAGTFDIPLPLSGSVGVECRSGGATNDYQMIVDFPTTVTVESVSVTSGTGSVSSFTGSGTSQITVNLTGVTNVQTITVTLHNVNNGTSTGDVPVSMGVLIGDVNGNATVNSSDVALTKSQVGVAVSGSNFREDVNANGVINSVDVAQVKANVGTALP